MAIGKRIKEAAQKIGGLNKLADAISVSRRTLGSYVSDESEPTATVLCEIISATGVSPEWLLGVGIESGAAQVMRQLNRLPSAYQKADNTIPNLLTHAGMGNGGLEHVEVDEDGHPLDLYTDGAWSFPIGIAGGFRHFKGVYALEVEGDSMEPTYAGGSTVFVDTRRKDPRSPGCFIVDYGDGLMLKRIELIGGTDQMAVISDNRDFYRSYEFPRDQVHIWGRVIAKWEWVK